MQYYSFCIRYKETKGLSIIQDFTAHCAIKNERMVQFWKFDSKSEFEEKIPHHTIGFSPLIPTMNQILKLAPFAHFVLHSELSNRG
jgi:hypothetical protein